MNGTSAIVDTNILIYLFKGNEKVFELLEGRELWVSFITEIELLSYNKHTPSEIKIIRKFLDQIRIVDLNRRIKDLTIDIRKSCRIKTPDAIIAASANYLNIPLITADKDFKSVEQIISVIVDI